MKKFLLLIALLPSLAFAQETKKEDLWQQWRPLIGEWSGTGSGKAGESQVTTQFRLVLDDKYLEVRNKAIFQPQEKNPSGEVHEDWGMISFDRARDNFVFRQFHVEGFVNHYVLDSVSADGKLLIFVSESLENAPPGMQARWSLKITGEDECQLYFDLAFPGGEFSCFSENAMHRKK